MLLGGPDFSLQPTTKPCAPQDTLLVFHGEEIVLAKEANGQWILPTHAALQAFLPSHCAPMHYMSLGDRQVYGFDGPLPLPLPQTDKLAYCPVSSFRSLPMQEDAFIMITAYHLAAWYRNHHFCGACAAPTHPLLTERALCCDACGAISYPTIAPAVSVAVTQGDRLLLARNAKAPSHFFSLIAGYVEAGEAPEQTAHREVWEEVGLHIHNLRYVGSQPWGVSQALMLGFHGELVGSSHITLQESELSEARWFTRQEIKPNPTPASLSFDMIEKFRTHRLP